MDDERLDAEERPAAAPAGNAPETPAPPAAAARPALVDRWEWTLWAMVVIQFVMTMSFTVLSPIVPLFLPEIGVGSPGAVALWAGILNASTPFVAAFTSPLWGRLADRRGRKLMLIRSGIAIGIFTGLMGLSWNIWFFFAMRALMGAFAGFAASAIALVASQAPERRLGYALGWLATGQLVGSLVGPVIGGGLADVTGSYRIPFYCTAAIALVATALVWFAVHEHFIPPKRPAGRRSLLGGLGMLTTASGLLPLFVVLLMAQFGVRTVQPVVTLFVQELVGDVPQLATLGGIAFSITGLADLVASPFLGKRSDVIGYRRVLLICLCGAAVTSIPQAFASSYWEFLGERFAVGLFIGGILPTANALVGRMVPRAERGAVYGLTASASFLGNSLGPLTGGVVGATIGLRWVFLVTAALLFANLAWVYFTVPEYREEE
ncbi:MAG TPA: MFS transporter [Hyphomicrobiales bacterium]|nr:MFS transporter [Hyphomicrobiales bacterium]